MSMKPAPVPSMPNALLAVMRTPRSVMVDRAPVGALRFVTRRTEPVAVRSRIVASRPAPEMATVLAGWPLPSYVKLEALEYVPAAILTSSGPALALAASRALCTPEGVGWNVAVQPFVDDDAQ